MTRTPPPRDPARRAVVTGMGAITPIGNDVATYWSNLVGGVSGVGPITAFDASDADVRIAAEVNEAVENIGARRLQTVMEKLLEEVSFNAEDRKGETLTIDAAYVDGQLAGIARNTDLSRFVL